MTAPLHWLCALFSSDRKQKASIHVIGKQCRGQGIFSKEGNPRSNEISAVGPLKYTLVAVWFGIATGIVTALATVYGVWREWQTRRQQQATRLATAAASAVRRTEATIVRPLLTERMGDTISVFVQQHPLEDPTRFRTLLFRHLQQSMQLSEEEKLLAKQTAVNILITTLQGMPSAPLRVKSDDDINKNLKKIQEAVETAYGIRPRPTVEMLNNLATFCGGTVVVSGT